MLRCPQWTVHPTAEGALVGSAASAAGGAEVPAGTRLAAAPRETAIGIKGRYLAVGKVLRHRRQ